VNQAEAALAQLARRVDTLESAIRNIKGSPIIQGYNSKRLEINDSLNVLEFKKQIENFYTRTEVNSLLTEITSEDDLAANLITEIDDTGSGTTYVGQAAQNSATTDPVWRIKRVVVSGSDVSVKFAPNFVTYGDQWSVRVSLSYT
jgi:hypothetical protein